MVRMVAATGWRFSTYGPPSKVLTCEKYRIPFSPKSGDVVVKMLAAPVHRQDKSLIQGVYGPIRKSSFPAVAGIEGVGIVEEVGSSVSLGIREGDLVWINNPRVGTFTTHVVTDANNVDVLPNRADLDVEYLASMSLFHTAYHLTHDYANLHAGDVVLQAGATSSVAQLCAGYARARGLKVFQTIQMGRSDHEVLVGSMKRCGVYAVVPYHYARSNYMRRLLSDLPPPKLLLNHTCGQYASQLVKLVADGGTVVTYGNTSHMPMQVAAMDCIRRGIVFKGFFFPRWVETHSREQRMRVHQHVVDYLQLTQGHVRFRAQRYRMDGDAPFAFCNAWDAPLASRKAVLRMVGEYGEWRAPPAESFSVNVANAVWEDMAQQMLESHGSADNPHSMQYYTPFDNMFKTFFDEEQCKEVGYRDIFFRRPNAPRYKASEEK